MRPPSVSSSTTYFFSGFSERFRDKNFTILLLEMATFLPAEKGMTIRQPATANLCVDSQDRDGDRYIGADDFLIFKKQSILNGFFTRVGTTELTLEWGVPNVSADASNNFVNVEIGGTAHVIPIPQGFYTVADALITLAKGMDDLSGSTGVGVQVALSPVAVFGGVATARPGNIILTTIPTGSATQIEIFGGGLAPYLFPGVLAGSGDSTGPANQIPIPVDANLRIIRYLDFTSEQLTYNQDLKDDSTSEEPKNVLARWYMAYDNETSTDQFGYPVLMGYRPFVLRRLWNPPKQIRWDNAQPVGQLSFQVYPDPQYGYFTAANDLISFRRLAPDQAENFDYLMTLQISES